MAGRRRQSYTRPGRHPAAGRGDLTNATAAPEETARAPRPRGGVTAILLAAGLSSRLGTPKPLLPLAGKPLLAHSLDALRGGGVSEIVVVLGAEADRVRRGVSLEGTRVVVNADFEEGMSSSIRAGLRNASLDSEAYLIMLGDQPLVAPATIRALVERRATTLARILIPTYAGVRGNPVLLEASLSGEIEAVRGDVGCRSIVAARTAEVVEVPVDDPGILVDVDTLEDLRRIEAALRTGTPIARLVGERAGQPPP